MPILFTAPNSDFSSNPNLQKLYPDGTMTTGTVGLFDARDWETQAAPTGEPWLNLVEGGGNAIVETDVGFSNGGFVFDADADNIIMPPSFTLAPTQNKFCWIIWIKNGATPETLSGVAGCALGNSNTNSQYYVSRSNSGLISMGFATTPGYNFTPIFDQVYQLAISGVRNSDGTGYDVSFFKDGVQTGASFSSVTSLFQSQSSRLGNLAQGGGYSDDWIGTGYRVVLDDLSSGIEAANLVAKDYAANTGKFG